VLILFVPDEMGFGLADVLALVARVRILGLALKLEKTIGKLDNFGIQAFIIKIVEYILSLNALLRNI
jgi:hypothetical protein